MSSSLVSAPLLLRSPLCRYSTLSKLSVSKTLQKPNYSFIFKRDYSFGPPLSISHSNGVQRFPRKINRISDRRLNFICFCNAKGEPKDTFQGKETGPDWPILKRWNVPWQWQTVSFSMITCAIGFVLTGFVEASVLPYLGLQIGELSLDEKAELLFVDQAIVTTIVLGVIYGFTKSFQPLPDDIFRYELKDPFSLQRGWLLWTGFGLVGALLAIALTGAIMALFSDESPQRETDALVRLLPLIGSSSVSTACLLGITGVLAPLLEETVFRGFLMVSMTKWVPTPVSVLISAAVFAIAHLTPGEFPQLFVLGTALGFSYAQTRNLLTPITIHALWNSGVILLLTFLQIIDLISLILAFWKEDPPKKL